MDKEIASVKIQQSLETIFAYALKRTKNRFEAEDLSQDIVMNLFSSIHSLKDPKRFYGWMWAVANNVYKGYLRKKEKHKSSAFYDAYLKVEGPEHNYVEKEELGILNRELSALSGHYREAMVLYYLNDISCEEIANKLGITQEMVKQYLFKSRRKVKDGMAMIRETGEKSYNPKNFSIYTWGTAGNHCAELFKRKLPGNIMLETYYEPVSIEQLSAELGVSTVYLEDELEILYGHGLIKKLRGTKFQSNIIIFTQEFEDDLNKKNQKVYQHIANLVTDFLREKEGEIRSIGFSGNHFPSNTLVWQLASLTLSEVSIYRFLANNFKGSEMPLLSNGSRGYMWALEKLYGSNKFNLGVGGGQNQDGKLRHINFALYGDRYKELWDVKLAERLVHLAKSADIDLNEHGEEVAKLVQGGYLQREEGQLSFNFPIFTQGEYEELIRILSPLLEELYKICEDQFEVVKSTLKNYVPPYLKDQLTNISLLKVVEDFIRKPMEYMLENNYIVYPKDDKKLLTTLIITS